MADETLSPETVATMEAVFGPSNEAPAETPAEDTEAPAKVEPAKAEPEKPKDERAAARIAAAQRAESRAAKQRAEIEAQRAEVERQRAEVKQLAELSETIKTAKSSPSKALELLGYDAKAFIESLATEHDPSSEAKREIQKTQSETEKLRAEIEALRKEREAEAQDARAREIEAATMATQQAFVEFVATSHEKYPHLCEELTPEEIGAEGLRIAAQYAKAYRDETGEDFTDEVLADYLESQAKARAERRASFKAKFRPAQAGDHGQQLPKAQPDIKSQNPRTLTSRIAGEKASPPKEWSQEIADEQSLQILKGATAA